MLDLEKWNADMGGPVTDSMFAARKSGFEWKMERGYFCRVTRASIVTSQRGDVQLRLALDIFANDEAEGKLGDCLEHLTLPRQESDRNFEKSKVAVMSQRRMQDIQKVLIAAQPALYKTFERKEPLEGRPGVSKYIGFDGRVLSGEAFKARQREVNTAADQKTIEWHQEPGDVDELADAGFYVVRRENPRAAKYPYLNIYLERPKAVPMVDDEAAENTEVDGPVPF